MDWVILSFVTAIAYTAHSLFQKYAFQRHVRSILAFSFWAEALQAAVGLVILAAMPVPYPWLSFPVFLLLLGGAMRIAIVLLRAWAIRQEKEVSRIVPVLDAYPVFVAILAVLALGERLSAVHWLAIFLVVAGIVLTSSHQALGSIRLRNPKTLLIALGASLAMAAYSVIGKASLEYVSFWHLLAFSSLWTAPVSGIVARRMGSWPEVLNISKKAAPFATTAGSSLAIMTAFAFGFMAFERGPVSLASAIMATRPLWIVVYSIGVAYIAPRLVIEPVSATGLKSKAVAAALVVLGVSGIALS